MMRIFIHKIKIFASYLYIYSYIKLERFILIIYMKHILLKNKKNTTALSSAPTCIKFHYMF